MGGEENAGASAKKPSRIKQPDGWPAYRLEERDGYGKLSWLLSMAEKDGVYPSLEHPNSLSNSKLQIHKYSLQRLARSW